MLRTKSTTVIRYFVRCCASGSSVFIIAPLLIHLPFSRGSSAPNKILGLPFQVRPSAAGAAAAAVLNYVFRELLLVGFGHAGVHTSLAQLCGSRSAVFRSGSLMIGPYRKALTCLRIDASFISLLYCADLWWYLDLLGRGKALYPYNFV